MSESRQRAAPASGDRRVRADARRNLETLLKAALEVFTAQGVDAPVRDIAKRAGVGIGTVYRHFPQRADLIAAVFRNEVDNCADAAPTLARRYAPHDALIRWIDRYVELLRAKRGLASAVYSGDAAYSALPDYFATRLQPALQGLLDAASNAGAIRRGVAPSDLLWGVASLCAWQHHGDVASVRRMIALLMDGLKVGAETGKKRKRR